MEHLHYEAVRVHPPDDADLLRRKVPGDRILRARFAYRDKSVAKRREDPGVPAKAKARLCVGGHMDPDLKRGEVTTEAPTASKTSLFTLLYLASQLGWRLAAGDIEAAFLNGVVSKRNLYFEPPKRGLPGVEPGSLIEIVKVFLDFQQVGGRVAQLGDCHRLAEVGPSTSTWWPVDTLQC